jgi:hypothetical protein
VGDRGRVVHVRVSGGAASLKAAGPTYTELATNRRWTSLAPLDFDDFDGAAFAAAVGADVVQVWFDDDAGVMLQVDGADGFAGQLSVDFFDAGGAGIQDRRFIDAIVRRKLLTAAAARDLKKWLDEPPKKRDAWIRRHGLEKTCGFPFTETFQPSAAPARNPAPARGPSPSPSEDDWTVPLPRRYRLPDAARPTLDLHVFYWTEVWSMNTFTLYNRYKKHLPAADRGLVDELANAAAMGTTAEIPSRVEHILQKTWEAEDWGAFIRSPKVDDPGTDDDTARRWREMTGRGEALH